MQHHRIFWMFTLLMLSFQPLYAASSHLEAGYVEKITGTTDTLILRHNGNESTPSLLTPLYEGDTLTISDQKSDFVSMMLSIDHQPKELSKHDFPYTVPIPKGAASIAGNVMLMMKQVFASLQTSYGTSIAMAGRGWLPALSLPAVMTKQGNMLVGKHRIILEWTKARPPYRIELIHKNTVIQAIESEKLSAQLMPHDFSVGRYQLRIHDAEGRSRTAQFTVLEEAPAMKYAMYDELMHSSLSREMKNTLYMAWLIEQDPRWKLAAYQTLCAAPEEYATALLCHALIAGKTGGK